MKDQLKRLQAFWASLSPREQRLAQITCGLVALFAVALTIQTCIEQVDSLDAQIRGRQEAILAASRQIRIKEQVEEEYARIASQHSSAWSENEISDRLREEVVRLAQKNPPGLDENGRALSLMSDTPLVNVPKLGEGQLRDSEEGYREYSLSVRIPDSDFPSLLAYLERLERSPQTLRIDGINLSRPPSSTRVACTLELTRIVVDSPPELASGASRLQLADNANIIGDETGDWSVTGAEASFSTEYATATNRAIALRAGRADAVAFVEREVPAGYTYELTLDVAATADAELGILDVNAEQPFEQSVPIKGDGAVYRYKLRFAPPGERGNTATVGMPFVRMPKADTEVFVDGVILAYAEE